MCKYTWPRFPPGTVAVIVTRSSTKRTKRKFSLCSEAAPNCVCSFGKRACGQTCRRRSRWSGPRPRGLPGVGQGPGFRLRVIKAPSSGAVFTAVFEPASLCGGDGSRGRRRPRPRRASCLVSGVGILPRSFSCSRKARKSRLGPSRPKGSKRPEGPFGPGGPSWNKRRERSRILRERDILL